MKRHVFVCLCVLCVASVSAQTKRKFDDDFGNDEIRQSHYLYPGVKLVENISVNDGIQPIEFNRFNLRVASWLAGKTGYYEPNKEYVLDNGTRIVIKYLPCLTSKDSVTDYGIAIFVINRDLKSYVVVFADTSKCGGKYEMHFNRALKAPGSMYNAFDDPPIIGVDPDMDQKTLYELLYDMLPNLNALRKESRTLSGR